jgi:uncharacterized protein YrrD
VELGAPISYAVLSRGTAVYSADGHQIGNVAYVLAVSEQDVFDGIVLSEHWMSGGHRFADADDVDAIYERGVVLRLDRDGAERLPEPSANPAVVEAEAGRSGLERKLRRAWDYISGNY